jgi:hypothetical protein
MLPVQGLKNMVRLVGLKSLVFVWAWLPLDNSYKDNPNLGRFVGEEHQPLDLHHCINLRSIIIRKIFFFASFFFYNYPQLWKSKQR